MIKGTRYRIMLSDSTHKRTPYTRYIYRDSDKEALDAAARELRRVINTYPMEHSYDLWRLDQVDLRGQMIRPVGQIRQPVVTHPTRQR